MWDFPLLLKVIIMASIKAILASASSFSFVSAGATEGCSFGGRLGSIVLWDDGKVSEPESWNQPSETGEVCLKAAINLYQKHPAISGQPATVRTVDFEKINCPDGEDWGSRMVTTITDWLNVVVTINHGYRAGGVWVDGWVV